MAEALRSRDPKAGWGQALLLAAGGRGSLVFAHRAPWPTRAIRPERAPQWILLWGLM